jgi:SAM-dependent methyltransferase
VHAERLVARAARGYETDKEASYQRAYERFFEPLRGRDVRLLELGVYRGGSLLLWRDYFPRGVIAGLDANPVVIDDPTGRIRFYQGRQDDRELLPLIAAEVAPDGFDIVIDDASHVGALARASFGCLFHHHLKPGGIYVIEDWGTGYWESWPDGKSYGGPGHVAGMVGLVKELVDECGIADVTHSRLGCPPQRASSIARMEIAFGQVFVVKASGDDTA